VGADDRGDLSAVEGALAENATWRAVEDRPWNCESREAIIDVMSRNLDRGLRGRIEETIQTGPRVLLAFRPERLPQTSSRPFDDGIAYVVVTIRAGKIIEMKGCADRAAAIAYAHSGQAPASR
jgi:ketosteroid isomerase-like protein